MASRLAMKLTRAGLDAKDGLIQDALDECLVSVRQVLNGLTRYHLSTGPCWCPSRVSAHNDWYTPGEHNEDCDRARELYEQLQIETNPTTRGGEG
jgi:hypothetical protein